MAIKLIVSDIDGCIGGEVFEMKPLEIIRRYCEAVQEDQQLARFSFATGRGGEFVDCLTRMLNSFTPENLPSIVENGSFLFEPKGRNYIPHPLALSKEGLISSVRSAVSRLAEENVARFIGAKSASVSLLPVELNTAELEKRIISLLPKALLDELFVTHSTTAVDITIKGVDKGSCLAFLCQRTRIPIDGVLAIGDAKGDLPVLEAAGTAACPGNAAQDVKDLVLKRGGYVAKAPLAWGVIEILEHYDVLQKTGG